MYQITCDDIVIHDVRIENRKVLSPVLDLEIKKNGTLSFTIPPQNETYNLIKEKKSIIQVYQIDKVNNSSVVTELFRGTVYSVKTDFYNRKLVECEGELSFFNDSIVRPYNFQGSVETLFRQYVNNHNNLVNESKRFMPRNCTVIDTNDYITRANINYPSTKNEMEEKLLNIMGGHFETGANTDGTRYIDYLAEYSRISTQLIEFGKNMLDITQYIKAEGVATRIIPLGAKTKNGEERLNIESVNGGLDYIQDDAAVALFGIIEKTVIHDDVTQAENLLKKGKKDLQESINKTVSIELNAADLHNIDTSIETFRIGDNVRVLSKPHNLDRYFLLSKLHLTLDDVSSCSLTLGATFKTFTQNQIDNQKKLNAQIQNATVNVNNIHTNIETLSKNVKQTQDDVVEINNNVTKIPKEYVNIDAFTTFKDAVNDAFIDVCRFKGLVTTYELLEEIKKNEGDIYKVAQTGDCYIYKFKEWIKLSQDLSKYLKIDEAEEKYIKTTDFQALVERVEALEKK